MLCLTSDVNKLEDNFKAQSDILGSDDESALGAVHRGVQASRPAGLYALGH